MPGDLAGIDCGFLCSFSEDQQGHALPGFAKFRELSGHQERSRGSPISFLNRASQVRVLPGAPVNSNSTDLARHGRQGPNSRGSRS